MLNGDHNNESSSRISRRSSRTSSVRRKDSELEGRLARNGSMFQSTRNRDTQMTLSMHGSMNNDTEELQQGYGDMARRSGVGTFDGLKSVKSYRGEIQDGDDVGLPRRVTTRRNVGATTTGYAGIAFKRAAAMRNGQPWAGSERRVMQAEMETNFAPNNINGEMYTAPDEMPQAPQVYLQDDKRTYSNMSDMYM